MNIIVPVECSNEEYDIYNILKNSTYFKSRVFLEMPESKTKKSAITFLKDKKLAVLLYSTKEKSGLQMAVFSKNKDKWKYFLNIPLDATKLDTILTIKNKKENREYLVVGTIKNSEKTYNIYDCNSEKFKKIYSNNYKFIAVCDINSDGVDELITLSNLTNNNKNTNNFKIKDSILKKIDKHIYSIFKEKFKVKDLEDSLYKKNINLFFVSFVENNCVNVFDYYTFFNEDYNIINYKFDTKTLNSPCLFLTADLGPLNIRHKRTFIINFGKNNNEICSPHNQIENNNFAPVSFLDINKDSKLEFAHSKTFPGYFEQDMTIKSNPNQPFISVWTTLKNEFKHSKYLDLHALEKIDKEYENTYVDYKHNFGIKLPKRWINKVTAKYKNNNKNIEFFVYEGSLEKDSKKLLSIQVDYLLDKEKLENGYFVLHKKNNILYVANIYSDIDVGENSLKLTKKELKSIFFTV